MKTAKLFWALLLVATAGCGKAFDNRRPAAEGTGNIAVEAELIDDRSDENLPDGESNETTVNNHGVTLPVHLDSDALVSFEYNGITVHHTPEMKGADKVLFLFHGAGGSSSNLVGKEEYQKLVDLALQEGFYIIIPESSNRDQKQWNNREILIENNVDLQNTSDIIDILQYYQLIPVAPRFYGLGHSNGGAFASVAAYSLKFEATSINGASGIDDVIASPDYSVPTVFAFGEDEPQSKYDDVQQNFEVLRAKGVRTELYINNGVGHPFSAEHDKAFVSFFLNLNNLKSESDFTYLTQGPEEKDEIDGLTVDADGYTYVSGDLIGTVSFNGTERTSKGWRDIFIAKLDKEGKEVAFWVYGTTNDDVMYDLTHDGHGHLIVNGTHGDGTGFPNGDESYQTLTMKIDANTGEVIWRKTFGSGGGNEVVTDSSGNIYATYMSNVGINLGHGLLKGDGNDTWSYLVKLSPEGNPLWHFKTTSEHRERIRAVAVGYDDTRVIVGYEFWNGIRLEDGPLYELGETSRQSRGAYAVLDSKGNLIKSEVFASETMSNARASGGFSDGLYIHGIFKDSVSVGETRLASKGQADSFLARLNENGDVVWAKTYGNETQDSGGEMAVSPKGDIFITGNNSGDNFSMYDSEGFRQEQLLPKTLFSQGYVLQLSALGKLIWSESLNQKAGSSATGVIEYNNGHLAVNVRLKGAFEMNGRWLSTYQPGGKDAAVIKYSGK